MILIAHRGNIDGKVVDLENRPDYVDRAIALNYDVEIDLWVTNGFLYVGHDSGQYQISWEWLRQRMQRLWVHCKSIEAVEKLNATPEPYNYFWHETDTLTLTSAGYIWAYPSKQPIKNSIAVLPEVNDEDTTFCQGICSDYIVRYLKNKNL